jgi:hypothetical protein
VRYYDKIIHPDHFQGFLGFWIRVLNSVRWRMEVLVQRLVLRYLAKEGALPKERRADMKRVFDLDVQAERLEKERTSPKTQKVEEPAFPPITRSERYADGRQTSAIDVAVAVENDFPVRPKRLNNLIASYGAPGREKHYAKGRMYTSGDPDGDFEPLVISTESKDG